MLSVILRPLELPIACVRSAGDITFLDVPWPLTSASPRRLGVHRGELVEVTTVSRTDEAPLFTFPGGHAYAAQLEVPLLWLLDAGVQIEGAALADAQGAGVYADAVLIGIDGRARTAPQGEEAMVNRGPRVKLREVNVGPGLV